MERLGQGNWDGVPSLKARLDHGHLPEGGLAPLVPEFAVTDLPRSLLFWCGLLGFEVAYDRPEARFSYLVRGPLQVMLSERNGHWETGDLDPPFGRGVSMQMLVAAVSPILAALSDADWPLYQAPAEAWYRAGAEEVGQREFLVQDPDGYLLRFAESLGVRPKSDLAYVRGSSRRRRD